MWLCGIRLDLLATQRITDYGPFGLIEDDPRIGDIVVLHFFLGRALLFCK